MDGREKEIVWVWVDMGRVLGKGRDRVLGKGRDRVIVKGRDRSG